VVSFINLALAACRSLIAKNKVYALVLLYFVLGLCLKMIADVDCLPPCLISFTTGIDCWGCGLTRATTALIKLDFASAYELNPLVFIVLPSIALLLLYSVTKELKRLSEMDES
jgi:hypothetical protein